MAGSEERVALIEVVERDGRVRQQLAVARWPLAIGRAFDCDVVLDDPHVAPHHARLVADDDGRVWLEVGDTRNGVRIGPRLLRAGDRLPLERATGCDWVLGHTRLRLRLRGETLAPERALPIADGVGWTLVFSLLLWALMLGQHAIERDPDAGFAAWLPLIIGPPLVLVLWCAAWAAASKLFQHRFEFEAHWALAARWLLGTMLGGALLTLVAATLAWPQLFRWIGVAEAAALTALLALHAKRVLPAQGRAIAASFAAAFVVGAAALAALNHQREQPLVGPLYMHVLPHPQWRVAQPVTPERFAAQALEQRARLDARARAEPDEADTPAADPAE